MSGLEMLCAICKHGRGWHNAPGGCAHPSVGPRGGAGECRCQHFDERHESEIVAQEQAATRAFGPKDETAEIFAESFAIRQLVSTSVAGLDPPRPGPAVWICTLVDGREITTDANGLVIGEGVGAKYGRELPVVEWRKVGEPSRVQMRAALEAAGASLAAFVGDDRIPFVRAADTAALAAVRAALGKAGT